LAPRAPSKCSFIGGEAKTPPWGMKGGVGAGPGGETKGVSGAKAIVLGFGLPSKKMTLEKPKLPPGGTGARMGGGSF